MLDLSPNLYVFIPFLPFLHRMFINKSSGYIKPLYMRDMEFIKDKRAVIPQLKGMPF
ncbi:hypothetical protein NC653_033849 [Populus alba x Populus x berolinensis]|uniref:Uncharacterized protein n=1 Tax=Populus alba x Populus x berolinensis TaxID=444605 RepID=A0AAD6LUT0_9ROSI|nr:hypothetical protein NC653_033849 [Populus alba x Populus x berolinensis]